MVATGTVSAWFIFSAALVGFLCFPGLLLGMCMRNNGIRLRTRRTSVVTPLQTGLTQPPADTEQ